MRQGSANLAGEAVGGHKPESGLAREQTALYRLTDRLYRASGLAEIYEAALDAICDSLATSRASILRFDTQGVMRFVASRSLSEQYRSAVDGHSPWSLGERGAEPIFVEDIRLSGEPTHLVETILGEGIEALAFIPVTSGRELVGKFTVYYPSRHSFTERERELAITIARQLGFAIERSKAETTAARLTALVDSSDDAIIAMDPHGTVTDWNRGAQRLYGYKAEEIVGRSILLLNPADHQDEEPAILARIRRGEHVERYETIRVRKDGSIVPVSLTVSPIADASGAVVGASKISRDISEQLRAQERQELLLHEMDHRVKNLFAIASSIVNLSAAVASSPAALASLVSARLGALARAHALTMLTSASASEHTVAGLHALIGAILAPYQDDAGESPRIRIGGVDPPVPTELVTPLALLLHEFATNAAKYGGLSTASGSIQIDCAKLDDETLIRWREFGGPAPSETVKESFGSRLVVMTAAQIGRVDRTFEPGGAAIDITINTARFSVGIPRDGAGSITPN
jgi:PAS domain S-box-containing protein